VPDQTRKIAEDLDQLVQDGQDLQLAGALGEYSGDKRKEAEARLEKNWLGSRRGKTATKEAGRKVRSPVIRMAESSFGPNYQRWYSQALRVIEQLLPERYAEFRELYRLEKMPKELDVTTYTISDYMNGTTVSRAGVRRFNPADIGLTKFGHQLDILASARSRLDSLLADIKGTLEATLLDDELSTASELLKAKHLRSAGIVAGVVLERHLKSVLASHQLTLGRKKSQISNLNNALKEGKVIDVPRWREIQRLGDIRNLCGHDGEREPAAEEVEELIKGTEKVIAQVF
jgi:hypothetical protein